MAVTNNATVLEDFEGAGPTFSSIGGGAGAALNTDIFIAGSQSGGRRTDNKTAHGFSINPGTTYNLSGSGEHVKVYYWVTHYPLLTALAFRIGHTTTAYETHTVTVSEYPPLGGWFPVWMEVDAGTDTGTPDFTIVDEIGVVISIGDVGGNAQNSIMDQVHHSTRPVMTWDGSTGAFSDFATTDDANALGTLLDFNGAYFLYANVQLGSSTATTFTDSGVTVISPDFSHIPSGSTWTGIDIDLQNASTVITWTDSVFGAADPAGATNKPDLIVTGTSGTATLSRNRFDGLRIVTLTTGVTMDSTTVANSGLITAAGATLTNCLITDAAGAVALLWNTAADPNGELDGTSFKMGGTNSHAIEFGSSTPASVTLTDVGFSGYAGTDGSVGNEAIYNNTGGALTINISGGDTPSIRNGTGASTTVVNSVTVSVTVKDAADASNVETARVYLEADTGGDLPADASVTITRSGSTATVTHTAHGLTSGNQVKIKGANQREYTGAKTITVTDANTYTYTVSGTPTTPATGTITSTAIILNANSSAAGVVQDTGFAFTSNQPVVGRVRRGTTSPRYKTSPIAGTITSSGFSATVFLVTDE